MTKAYKSENHEGIYTIVFADDANKARSIVHTHENGRSCDMDYTDIRVHRAKEYDKYDGSLPSLRVLVKDHDWFVECSECSRHIDSDEKGRIWIDDDTPVCSNCKTPMQVLKALSEIGEKAVPGEWRYDETMKSKPCVLSSQSHPICYVSDPIHRVADGQVCEDGQFIAQAANARPALKWAIDTIRDLQNQIKGMSPVSNRDWIASDIATLKNLIKGTPEGASLTRMSLEDRLKNQEAKLAELDSQEKENPKDA